MFVLSNDDTFNLFYHVCTKLSTLVKIYCLYSEILYIFDNFGIQKYLFYPQEPAISCVAITMI